MPKLKNYINKELLIDLVHKRPAIWNKNMDIYKDIQLKYAAWREICAILRDDFEQLNKTDSHAYVKSIIAIWAQTRDSWVRSLHEKKKGSRNYLYHKQMLFLKDVVCSPDIQKDVPEMTRKNRNMEIIVKEERYVSEVEFDTDSGEDEKFTEQTYSSSNEEFQDTNRKPIRAIEEIEVLSTRSDEIMLEAARTSKRMQEIDQRIMSYMGSRMSNVVMNQEHRHMLFFKSILPSLSLLNDDQILEFQSGVIRLLQNIKKGHHNDE